MADIFQEICWVGATQDWVQIHPIPQGINTTSCFKINWIRWVVRHRIGQVQRDADFLRTEFTQTLYCQAVSQVLVMHRGQSTLRVLAVLEHARQRHNQSAKNTVAH